MIKALFCLWRSCIMKYHTPKVNGFQMSAFIFEILTRIFCWTKILFFSIVVYRSQDEALSEKGIYKDCLLSVMPVIRS
jgi:hypothetical protein